MFFISWGEILIMWKIKIYFAVTEISIGTLMNVSAYKDLLFWYYLKIVSKLHEP